MNEDCDYSVEQFKEYLKKLDWHMHREFIILKFPKKQSMILYKKMEVVLYDHGSRL